MMEILWWLETRSKTCVRCSEYEVHVYDSGVSAALTLSSFDMAVKFLDWYVKIAVFSALIGGSMELFMIKTGFYDKVTVLESEKRAWENSPEAQAMREALNPWRNHDAEAKKNS
ncbi:uncharacterized protein LOC115727781 isoform X1 [Rhodamnia argentea]|uniref:Uncharacterized protein LOC115727781 isoform X1 n=2 Tax=Rhodamnia argentea TaxID=178133 RepID=A0ABM3GZY8_9MYRT|nr:uncharacterized protein LOC115727781 isoform X1 [Rhodamnia argentea]